VDGGLTGEVEQGTPNNCRGNSLLVTFLGASCELAPLGSNSFGWQWVAPPTHGAIIRNVSSHVDMETYVVGITYAIAAMTSPHSKRSCRAQIAHRNSGSAERQSPRSQARVGLNGCRFYPTCKDSRLVWRHLLETNTHKFVLQVVDHRGVR